MHLWLHLCSVHESDSCITYVNNHGGIICVYTASWYDVMPCHTMSYQILRCATPPLSSCLIQPIFAFLLRLASAQGRFKDIQDSGWRQWRNHAQSDFSGSTSSTSMFCDVLCQLLQLPPAMRLDCVFAYVNPWFFLKRHKMRRWIQNNRIWPLICVDLATEPQWIHMDPHGLFSACFSTSLSRSWVHWQIGEVQRPSASSLLLVSNVSSDASRRFDDPHCHAHQFGHTILLLRSAMFRGGKRDIAVEIIEIS